MSRTKVAVQAPEILKMTERLTLILACGDGHGDGDGNENGIGVGVGVGDENAETPLVWKLHEQIL
jgi:hypothetical protein